MSTDASLKIGADTTVFSTKMQELVGISQRTLEKIGGAWLGFKGITAGLQSVGAVFASFTAPAAELENVATSMGLLMGNAAEAERLAKGLQMLAVNGVRSFDELHKAARPLAQIYTSADAIREMVGRMADLAAASKVPADRIAGMMARLNDMGKAEFTELANANIPIFEALAEVTGKTVGEVTRLQSQMGGITVEDLANAIRLLTDETGRFHAVNATMSNTTQGSWDTLKASVEACMAELGKPINDAVRPLLQDLSGWLQKHQGALERMGKNLAPGLQAVAQMVGGLAKGLVALGGSTTGAVIAWTLLGHVIGRGAVKAGTAAVGAFGKLQASLVTFRASCVTTGGLWAAMCGGMAAAMKAACIKIKAQLISTGIGILIWGLAEAAAWAYEKFQDAEEGSEGLAEAAEGTAAALQSEAKAAREAAEAAAAQTKEEEARAQALKDTEKRVESIAQMERERRKAARAAEIDAMKTPQAKLRALYSDAGYMPSQHNKAQVEADMARIRGFEEFTTDADVARYKELAGLLDSIAKVEKEAAAAAAEHAKVEKEARANYAARKLEYTRHKDDERREGLSIGGQERELQRVGSELGVSGKLSPESIRTRLDELAAAGAKTNEKEIAALERLLAAWDKLAEKKEAYAKQQVRDRQELRATAMEAAGDTRGAAKLRQEMAIAERVEALQNAGASKRAALQQATMEAQAAQAMEMQQRLNAARVDFVQGHLAEQGGGGVSRRISDGQLAEAKLQSKLLKEVKGYLSKIKDNTKAGAGGVAVLA